MATAFATRSVSVPAIKSQMSQFMEKQSGRCWFAPWLTLPQVIIKGFEFALSVITIGLLSSWESEGVKITSLNQEEYNYRNRIYYFVGVSCITVLYSVAMTTLGFMGIKVPSKALTFFAGVVLFFWLSAAPIMSATLQVLEDSVYARKNLLDLLFLRIAVVFGFFLMTFFVFDLLLGFLALRRSTSSKEFKAEIKHSRSVLAAAKISARHSQRKIATNN